MVITQHSQRGTNTIQRGRKFFQISKALGIAPGKQIEVISNRSNLFAENLSCLIERFSRL